ncbi:MAG: endonuclease [Flavobacteriaceae bacterium]|nr:endonuclease [Flavobacteriaceae bacterium]
MDTENPQHNLYTVAFYNLENLFDIYDDLDMLDDDFTPKGTKKWNAKKYSRKVKKMASVISQIGVKETGFPPAIIGLAEVENKEVVKDLIQTESLQKYGYGYVHYDSADERGIEVAFLYRKNIFSVEHSQTFTLLIENEFGERDYTRDILLVKGKLQGETVYCIVNHWPSRREGEDKTEYKRIAGADKVHQIIDIIKEETDLAKVLIMGDFNDDPISKSIKQHLVDEDLYNPFESLLAKGNGSLNHNGDWHVFDQIIISKTFFEDSGFIYRNAYIFDDHFLKEWKGKRRGNPFRTYIGKWHQGGFSDHFPVYIILEEIV